METADGATEEQHVVPMADSLIERAKLVVETNFVDEAFAVRNGTSPHKAPLTVRRWQQHQWHSSAGLLCGGNYPTTRLLCALSLPGLALPAPFLHLPACLGVPCGSPLLLPDPFSCLVLPLLPVVAAGDVCSGAGG